MKSRIYILKFVICFCLFMILFSPIVFGVSKTTQDLISGMNITGTTTTDPTADSRVLAIIAQAFSVIQFIGTGISIIMIMWLGITYMISSIEEKAEIKKRAVPIVIGSVLIVATVNILKIVQQIVTDSL